jgi:hypothetical protein
VRPVFRSESKMKIFAFLILCFASVALAADFKTIDGKEYKNAKVSRVAPAERQSVAASMHGGALDARPAVQSLIYEQ